MPSIGASGRDRTGKDITAHMALNHARLPNSATPAKKKEEDISMTTAANDVFEIDFTHQDGCPNPKPTRPQLQRELAFHRDVQTFLPDEYVRLRKAGYAPCAIDYDMCHVFR